MKRKITLLLSLVLTLGSVSLVPSNLRAGGDESDDLNSVDAQDSTETTSRQIPQDQKTTLADSTGALEEEGEEEACDCGTMAEGECAPCPDGYDE